MNQSERVPSYTVGSHDGEEFIQCRACGSRSFHPRDVAERYCGRCHVFHDDADQAADLDVLQRTRALACELGELAREHPHLSAPIIRNVIQHVLVDFQARLLDDVAGPNLREQRSDG